MTARQRVLTALEHRQPDMAPYQIDFTAASLQKAIEYYNDPDLMSTLGNHLAIIGFGSSEEVKPGYVRDEFGVVWNQTIDKDIGNVAHYLLPEPDLKDLTLPDPKAVPFTAEPQSFLKRHRDQFTVCSIGFCLFERAWTLRGMEELLMDMVLRPQFVDQLLESITEYNLALMDRALAYNFDCIRFGDDWGQQTGLIFGKRLWERFFKPHYQTMFRKAKDSGRFVMLHSCGRVQELFPDLIAMGLDIFNTFQPEIMDPAEMKRQFGNDLTFYGGISTQALLPFASPEEIKKKTLEMIALVGRDGGYIAAPTHGIPGDVPAENIAALIEAVQEQA